MEIPAPMARPKPIKGYTSIRTSTLTGNRSLAMDIFIGVEDRAVRYAAAGMRLDTDRLERLQQFKLNKVLIKDEHEETYRSYLDEILNEAESNSKMEMKERGAIVSSGAETAAEDIIEKPTDEVTYTNSRVHFERFARFLQAQENALKAILQRASRSGPDDYISHGSQVAALCLAVCEKSRLIKTAKQSTSIITGGFLHDIGAEAQGIPRMQVSQLPPEMLRLWKAHPAHGASMMGAADHVDKQVLDIILEHEELPNGEGFPNKLVKKTMDPVAIVASLCNRYDHAFRDTRKEAKILISEFYTQELGRFDLDLLNILRQVIVENC